MRELLLPENVRIGRRVWLLRAGVCVREPWLRSDNKDTHTNTAVAGTHPCTLAIMRKKAKPGC